MARRPAVHSVTSAHRSVTAERDDRTRRYLVTMAVRVACLIASIAIPGLPVWARLAFIGGAVVLPWLAVVNANGGEVAERDANPALFAHVEQVQIEAATADRAHRSTAVLDGQVLGGEWAGGDTSPRRRSA